jgi:23S rRNA (uracil-5-)-methyltransferase RumA
MEKKKLHRKKYRNVIDRLAEPYLDSCAPKCAYFGRCGGCLFQNVDYEKQLLIKAGYLKDLLSSSIDDSFLEGLKVQGSTPFGYRNRMDFVAAFGKRGLRERGRFREVVDIGRCELMNEKLNAAWKILREKSLSIEDYDYLVHKGFLRYTVLRSAHFTGEIMATFVITRDAPEILPLIDAAKEMFDSVSVVIHDGFADLSTGEVAYNPKRGYIEERFGDITYRITSNSFFQSNSECALRMYSRIADNVSGNVLDLFSGVGSISLFAAKKAEHVTGVEIIPSAVEAAKVNAERNNVSNAGFVCADALPYMKENTGKFDTLILDPPRTGAHPKVLKAVQQCAPARIVYMSCNPVTFKDNLSLLPDYKVVSFEAYDMFPQTPHLETLAVLEKK